MCKCFPLYNNIKSKSELTIQQRKCSNLYIICNYFQAPQHSNGTHIRHLVFRGSVICPEKYDRCIMIRTARTGDKKVFCLGICQNWVNCDSATDVLDRVPNRTTYRQNNSRVVREIPAERLPVHCEMNRPAEAISRDHISMQSQNGSVAGLHLVGKLSSLSLSSCNCGISHHCSMSR
jgi:hypothetical protein